MTPSKQTLLSDVIKDCDSSVTVGDLARYRAHRFPDLYPKLLLACEGDQIKFLTHLWDTIVPTRESQLVWLGLIKNGFFTTLLDPSSNAARDLVRAATYPVEILREQWEATPRECSRCRRVRR